MVNYQGKVNGIDAQATNGLSPRCQAFIVSDDSRYIQVTTTVHSLQTALELASLKEIRVEITYDENEENTLRRVQLLDR